MRTDRVKKVVKRSKNNIIRSKKNYNFIFMRMNYINK